MVLYGLGLGLGGVVGGVVTDKIGWRYAFLLLSPLTVIAAIGIWFAVPVTVSMDKNSPTFKSRLRRIDFLGSFLLVSALVALLFGLDYQDSSSSRRVSKDVVAQETSYKMLAILLPISALLFLSFGIVEAKFAAEPIVPLSIMRNRTVPAACMTACFMSMAFYTLMFHVPLFFQIRGDSTSTTGLLLIPEAAGIATGCMGVGSLMRATGHYIYTKPFILIVFTLGAFGFSMSSWMTPAWAPELYLFANGLGFGGNITVLLIALLTAVDFEMQAVTTSVLYAFRTIGATTGISVSGMLFRTLLARNLPVSGQDSAFPDPTNTKRRDGFNFVPEGGCAKAGNANDRGCDAYAIALRGVFLLALGFASAALICGMMIKNNKLRSTLKRNGND